MKRIAMFEKVSFGQYLKDSYELYNLNEVISKSKISQNEVNMIQKIIYDNVILPVRSTMGSAGYDFRSTQIVELSPGESIVIATGVKCKIEQGWVLSIFPRSSLGFKYRAALANTVGIIDSDYYNNENNEGHIMIKICNDGNKEMKINEGDKIAQGIFLPYGITENDDVTEVRKGGVGSTGK